eukprot:m.195087 g.195087  ORF g.195087 m.195087 type:complete len:68 (+) comp39516_c0_seq28:38-241(+)
MAVIFDEEDFEYNDGDEEGDCSGDFLGSGAFSEVFTARLKRGRQRTSFKSKNGSSKSFYEFFDNKAK